MERYGIHRMTSVAMVALLLPSAALAQTSVARIHRSDGVTLQTDIASTDSISFSADGTSAYFHMGNVVENVPVASIDSITFGVPLNQVLVAFTASGPKVYNPYAFKGLDVQIDENGTVTATSVLTEEVKYVLTGVGRGAFKLYSAHKQTIMLSGVQLAAVCGPAINIQSKKKTTLLLEEGTDNTLADVASYADAGEEDQKATLFSEGQLVVEGKGNLTVTGVCKHAICSDDYIRIKEGNLSVISAANDGIHAKDYFQMDGGTLKVSGTVGDCIDAGEGWVDIRGGQLDLAVSTADTKALKCDSTLTVSGGEIHIELAADQSKGLKSGGSMTLSGGTLTFNCSGGVVVSDGDPSYCTAVKCDSILTLCGADLSITHTGTAGKGISTDIGLLMTSGSVTAKMTGNGGTYTNTSNESDTYCSTAMKSDGVLQILDGTLELSSSGSGGKCISADGEMTLGDGEHAPRITASTTGSKISSTSSGGGGWRGSEARWGGGPGGGGGFPGGGGRPGEQGNGGNPKAIRGEGYVTVNSGSYTISTAQDGGEGIESKSTLTINGGTIECNTYDDGINASKAIVINGGNIYSYASNNDGIDSNGTLTINGGLVIASGTTSPEEGFDCDNNTFSIHGGTLVGFGGDSSKPTESACTQCSVLWGRATATNGLAYTVCDADGNQLMSFTVPRAYGTAKILFSSPLMTKSGKYSIYTGGTLTGGTTFRGLTVGATFSGGTLCKSFNTTAYVNSL